MTENINENVNEIVEEVTEETKVRFARLKAALKKIDPVYVAVAASTAVAVTGMIFVSRSEKRAAAMEPGVIIVETEVDPATEPTV